MTDETRSWLRDAFDHWIRAAYDLDSLEEEVEERAADLAEEELDEADLAGLAAFVRQGVAAQQAREATWAEETTNDRLDDAFAELTDSGIVALQDAGYTSSDAWSDAAEAAREVAGGARGAVFWHGQDTERAVRGEGLLLGFGAFPDDEAGAVAIAAEVREVLAKYGIDTRWDGKRQSRIAVPPFEWRKRSSST